MNADDLDLLREKILLICRAAGSFGFRPDRMLRIIQRSGWEADDAALQRELRHLLSAGFIAPVGAQSLTPALVSYATTAAGDHELEKRGLLP